VSKKYLPLYLAEFQFRHNNRGNRHFRQGGIGMLMLKRTDWRSLQWTANDAGDPIQLRFAFLRSSHNEKGRYQD
jgi:hypothetical protein